MDKHDFVPASDLRAADDLSKMAEYEIIRLKAEQAVRLYLGSHGWVSANEIAFDLYDRIHMTMGEMFELLDSMKEVQCVNGLFSLKKEFR